MKKYKYLFIDLDDTLWDFHTNAKLSLRDIFLSEQLDKRYPDFDAFYQIYSKRNIELWTLYGQGLISKEFLMTERFLHPLKQVGIEDTELAMRMNASFLDVLATKTELIPHTIEILDFFTEKKIPITLISNGFKEVQYRKMNSAGIEHCFSHIVLSEMVGALKPSPDIFNYALQINQAKKNEVLMVGDSFEADIIGAMVSGIDAAYFNPRNRPIAYDDVTEGFIQIKDLRELKKMF
ncbi:MAG: YjjG family noncanonical pyrimidine nucleotidase [Paludibacteraceae bacterium]